jgi:hypothetical protein
MHIPTRRSRSRRLLAEQRLRHAVKLNGNAMFAKTAAVLSVGTTARAIGYDVNVFATANGRRAIESQIDVIAQHQLYGRVQTLVVDGGGAVAAQLPGSSRYGCGNGARGLGAAGVAKE